MPGYILKRLVSAIPVIIGLSVIVFGIMALIPGDPALAILGSYATPENVARINRELGLDRPVWEQYFVWVGNMAQGDFGRSFILNRPVIDEVLERFGATLILAGASLVLCSILGIFAGVVSAVRQFGWTDRIVTFFVLIGISTPAFWLGLIFILLFAVQWRVLPASGMYAVYGGGDLPDLLIHLILPATTLAIVATGVIARLTRAAMLEVLRQDFVRTARAKGLNERAVIYRHAFKAALVSIIPVIGIQAGFVMGGAVYIETVFQWPGIGAMLVNAISTRDILLVQGGVLVVAVTYVLINLLADVAQAILDPRLKT
ncbi:ABC transporter permease [Pelagibacterium halotolerans]|uniref:Dipeptide transport system permease protein DppB n=1 Tax=Pelagibacterium halotolerans (strain DSM 22347 / JCM 15775 / CGMCC 1.7692 / B2) TaxID=1082931 RepID=G4R5Y4_PELHB|nr:ABC transporter permease [Pelagibacterium halotolerans]AEQ51099.1 dipeptide transport system permease protein DppB [Pelagibacterium halotolerans B2]QJR19020.1 ABC transporter permease [Pelagibacterium halotolerans]SEA70739.1 peptide/nickel transport system permease protein [Pelagibacterium halotolerans]